MKHTPCPWTDPVPHSPNVETKIARARVICVELLRLVAENSQAVPAPGSGGRRLSRHVLHDRYSITFTQGCSLSLLLRGNNMFEEARVFDAGWDLLQLEVGGRRSLVVHTNGEGLELVEFNPGVWETWFGSEPGADTTPYKVPYVPKSLGDFRR